MINNLLKSFVFTWRKQVAAQLTTLGVLIGSFTVILVALLLHQNLQRVLTHWGHKVKVNVYLAETIKEKQTSEIKEALIHANMFEDIRYLSKSDAIEDFKERVGHYLPGLITDLEFDNPLPASFEMTVNGGLDSKMQFDNLVKIVNEIKKITGVEEISYGQGWVENYAAVLKTFSTTTSVLIIILLSAAFFIIGNSIRNSVSLRRDEIEIFELCGATRTMIIRPYIFEGAIMGFIGAIAAIIISFAIFNWQSGVFANELKFWSFAAKIEYFNWVQVILLILFGSIIGATASFLWVRKISTGWAAAESTQIL